MSVNQVVQCRFTWVSMESACPKCAGLNGMEWIQDINNSAINDPLYGAVWDLDADHSLVHPNCQCVLYVDVQFDPNQWTELTEFKRVLEENTDMSVETGNIASIREAIAGFKDELADTNITMRQGEMTLIRLVYAFRRVGLPPDMRQAVTMLLRVIQTVRLLQISVTMLEAASGPVGWLFAGIGLAATAITGASALVEVHEMGGC